ncbi:outer membrane protein assembly factor BamA [Pseudogemmobacter sonorensis]|uniref:outer membrane protein assembly factor BamA n=1 Tax=Pseudogemmobacter sonorensis TaxID=2989681 RepID=UPI0036B72412
MKSERRKASRRRPGAKALVAAVFIGAAGVCTPILTPAFAQVFSFSNVVVEGNQRVDAATILSYAGISRGAQVSAGALNDAYQRIMASGLFEAVEITPQGSTLRIAVREYPFVNLINFEGNRALKDEDLSKIIQSQARRAYSPSRAEADAAAIAEIYRVRGRIAATVEPKIIRRDGNRVDLVFEITEGKVVEIERLSFVGNRAFSDRRLRQVLETKQAGLLRQLIQRDTFVAERLEIDKQVLSDFYRSRGYIDFQVLDVSAEVSRERDATFVTFTIREGLSYDIGTVTTVSEVEGVNAAEFVAVQKIRSGQTWNPALIDNNITRMENLALRKGLNFVRVEPRLTRDDRNQRVNIEFAIVRGERVFVERIDIEGNATTLDQVVRRQFRSVEGDPFNPREIRQSAERIRALGFFSDAQVTTEPGSSADQVVVNVDVDEQPTGSLGLGLSYSVASGMGANISFSEANFLGRGQQIAFSLSTTSDNQNSAFSFTEPGLLGRDLRFSTGIFYRTSESDYSDYNTRNIGLNFGLAFPLTEESSLGLTWRLSQDKLYDVLSGSSEILQREQAQGKNGALITSALGYNYEFDNRITGLNPDAGFLFRFGQEFGGLGGDREFISSTVFAMGERRVLAGDVTLRAIVEGGYLHTLGDEPSRVLDRFSGRGKIRGFEPNGYGPRDLGADNEDALGGNAFAAMRLEAEFPLGLPEEYGILGGAFVDVGSVWSLDDNIGTALVDDGFKPRVAVGVSVLWNTPIGPLRFNFSKAVKKEDYDKEQNFDLTIQTTF